MGELDLKVGFPSFLCPLRCWFLLLDLRVSQALTEICVIYKIAGVDILTLKIEEIKDEDPKIDSNLDVEK